MTNFEIDMAQALEFALSSRADETDDRGSLGRYARLLAPRVVKAIDVLLPLAFEKHEAPIDGAALERRNAMRLEVELAVLAAIRESVFEEEPPRVSEMDGPPLWPDQGLAAGVWDLWTSVDGEFWDVQVTFRMHPGQEPQQFSKMRPYRLWQFSRAPWLGARLWRGLRGRSTHRAVASLPRGIA